MIYFFMENIIGFALNRDLGTRLCIIDESLLSDIATDDVWARRSFSGGS